MLHTLKKIKAGLRLKSLDFAYRSFTAKGAAPHAADEESVLILPAADGWEGAGPHGFGDEMLILGLLEGLKERFAGRVSALSMCGRSCAVAFHGLKVPVIGFSKSWLSGAAYREFTEIASGFTHFVVIGADVLDGAYGAANSIQRLRFLNIAAGMGLKTAITGCSFNGTDDRRICELLREAAKAEAAIHARDEVSLKRFGAFVDGVIEVSDLAFTVDIANFTPPVAVARVMEEAAEWKRAGGVVVGLNLCGWHITDKEAFFGRFIEECLRLSQRNRLALILLPHDTRTDKWCDLDTLDEFSARLGGRVPVLGGPREVASGIDAKHAVGCCDVLLTGRMHLAIAAHDQGIPSVSFGYQGKFEGFYGLYGMGAEWLVTYADPAAAVNVLRCALEARKELSARILQRMPVIRSMAHRNFRWLDAP